jgi:hypothetical protein
MQGAPTPVSSAMRRMSHLQRPSHNKSTQARLARSVSHFGHPAHLNSVCLTACLPHHLSGILSVGGNPQPLQVAQNVPRQLQPLPDKQRSSQQCSGDRRVQQSRLGQSLGIACAHRDVHRARGEPTRHFFFFPKSKKAS